MRFMYGIVRCVIAGVLLMAWMQGCATAPAPATAPGPPETVPWFGVHVFTPVHADLPILKRAIAEIWAPSGVNTLVIEMNYKFAYQSHPELAPENGEAITKDDARDLAAFCRQHGVRIIPQFNCLGHQSWGTSGGTLPLLLKYPEFDETPAIPQHSPDIYCRSWCPLHPGVNPIVFALIDELIDAFQPEAFHVGMDEVFLIADPGCPRCAGKDPGELFTQCVNDLYGHVVREKGLTMLMWGDRLLDGSRMSYSKYESSRSGTARAADAIPKDIIVCDWHYGLRDAYPSVPYLQSKGFRVWPSGWKNTEAALSQLRDARRKDKGKVIGYLCTTWTETGDLAKATVGETPPDKINKDHAAIINTLKACAAEFFKTSPRK